MIMLGFIRFGFTASSFAGAEDEALLWDKLTAWYDGVRDALRQRLAVYFLDDVPFHAMLDKLDRDVNDDPLWTTLEEYTRMIVSPRSPSERWPRVFAATAPAQPARDEVIAALPATQRAP
jgi:hypothetical protein